MPSEYSYVHDQPAYWRVRFDEWNGWEDSHIHAMQGSRELQVYTKTLEIKNQVGRFSREEIDEIKQIARKYASNYCLAINEEFFNRENDDMTRLSILQDLLFSFQDGQNHAR